MPVETQRAWLTDAAREPEQIVACVLAQGTRLRAGCSVTFRWSAVGSLNSEDAIRQAVVTTVARGVEFEGVFDSDHNINLLVVDCLVKNRT